MSIKGIDISSYQGNVDGAKIKASGIEIVIIKATQSINYKNPFFEQQYTSCKAAGLKVGFLHFLDGTSAYAQAQFFLDTIAGKVSDCKHVVDVEGNGWSISNASNFTRSFANYLINKGKEVCIYTGDYFYRDNLNTTVKDISLWVARYGATPFSPNIGIQYSASSRINGINGNVDVDNFEDGILLTAPVVKVSEVVKPVTCPKTGIVNTEILNVRESNNVKSACIGQLKIGTTVKIADKQGSFYQIYFGNHGGFVATEYIK